MLHLELPWNVGTLLELERQLTNVIAIYDFFIDVLATMDCPLSGLLAGLDTLVQARDEIRNHRLSIEVFEGREAMDTPEESGPDWLFVG